ncbi:MAG: 50S ribosomal protein L11 methyltransferase [Solirubrobacterales bacterium]
MIRLAVRCGPTAADRVLAELLQLAPGGVEEDSGPGWVEYAIYGSPGELPELGAVEAVSGDESIEVTSEQVPDDWADRWRDFHEPVWVADRVLIRPSWESVDRAAAVDVVIDPGQAFGTGAHPTTRMCVELMLALVDAGEAGGSLADLGTGSGVLAIVASKLGWAPVIGVDHEPAAAAAAAANALANEVEIELVRVNLREQPPPAADTVLANLTAPLLQEVAARLDPAPRRLICSGLLDREADAVAEAFSLAGLAERDRRASGEWRAIAFETA